MGDQGELSGDWRHSTIEALQHINEELQQPDWQERVGRWEEKRRSEVPSWQKEEEYRQAEKQRRLEERQRREEERRRWNEMERRRKEEERRKDEERERQYMQRVRELRTAQEIQSIEAEEISLKRRSDRQSTRQSQSSSRQLHVQTPRDPYESSGTTGGPSGYIQRLGTAQEIQSIEGEEISLKRQSDRQSTRQSQSSSRQLHVRDPYEGTSSGTTGDPSGGRLRTSLRTQSISNTSDRPQVHYQTPQAELPSGRTRATSTTLVPSGSGGQVGEVTPTSGCQCCCLIM